PDPSATAAFNPSIGSALSAATALSAGVTISSSSGNRIGRETLAARNLISGIDGSGIIITSGATNNLVLGNYIGTDVSGSFSLGLQSNGVYIQGASGNVIGGTDTNAGNLISGNKNYGVYLQDDARNNLVIGNIIGANGVGTNVVPNGRVGVLINNATVLPTPTSVNTIGGTTPVARNIISGMNPYVIVRVVGAIGPVVS